MKAVAAKAGHINNMLIPLFVTFGLTALSIPIAQAGPGDVNSMNDGRDIQSGTYFNTPGSRTTFQNSNGGLWLHAGDLVRGLESDIAKTPTGNGGTLYFRAPGNMVRLDGNIDVSAVRNGSLYTGNGGKVFIDSAYLFQSGNIFANGANGGLVQLNVGGMTLTENARITAQGFGGNGGTVTVNSPGTVDIRTAALIDTSGKVMGTIDTNVINIEGSAINNQGILRANGASGTDLKGDNGDAAVMLANPQLANNPVPGPITAGTGTGDTSMQNVLFGTPPSADFRGGTVRLIAAGQTNSTTDIINNTDSQILTATEKNALNNRNNLIVQSNEGDAFNRGIIQANGTLTKNGGTIIIGAARHAINSGTIQANGADGVDGVFDANDNGNNGGNGGTIVISALQGRINNTGNLQANGGRGSLARSQSISTTNGRDLVLITDNIAGSGGHGGVIALSSGTATPMSNTGSIQANGGVGGLGGHTNAFDIESGTPTNPNPMARAISVAGAGGTGGAGGLIVFSGNANPTGSGSVLANGGQGGRGGNGWADTHAFSNIGVPTAEAEATAGAGGAGGASGAIIAVNPDTFASTQTFSTKAGGSGSSGSAAFREVTTQNGNQIFTTGSTPASGGSVVTGSDRAIIATRQNEYIRNEDVGILMTQAGGAGTAQDTLSGRLADALIRTVANPNGAAGGAQSNAQTSSNFVVASTANLALTNNLVNSNLNPLFFNLHTLTMSNNGNLTNNMLWTPGVQLVGAGFHDMMFTLGGGQISWLANGNITNNGIVMTRGLWSGGSIHAAATQDFINNGDFINIGPNKALLSGFNVAGPLYESSHAGNLTIKAGRDFFNTSGGKIQTNQIFFDIHPPLAQNPPIEWPLFLNGAQIGATVNLLAGRNFSNSGVINAMALTYRNGQLGADNPALTMGGIVNGRARTGTITNTGTIAADGDAFFSPNESDGPRFQTNTFPATTSFDGTVDVH